MLSQCRCCAELAAGRLAAARPSAASWRAAGRRVVVLLAYDVAARVYRALAPGSEANRLRRPPQPGVGCRPSCPRSPRTQAEAFEKQLFGDGIIGEVIDAALAQLAPARSDLRADREGASEALTRVESEISRLTAAIATGGELSSLLAALKVREEEQGDSAAKS